MIPNTVGVIGAGVMGVGVAQTLAQSGFGVVLIDTTDAILKSAANQIKQNVRLQALLEKGAKTNTGAVLERIKFSTDFGNLADADFVIENVVEKWDVKKQVYNQIDALCQPHVVFAAN